jgi:peptidoglycan/xylan/chitin deacetylase (PgdA/CDA1 family)
MPSSQSRTKDAAARDFIGYGLHTPKVGWPGGARLALTVAVNYEAGGERSVIYGDEGPESYGEFASYGPPPKRDLGIESVFEYETRVAIWRILNLFDRFGVKVTFFATGSTLRVNPEAAKEIVQRGHEICGHGYRWLEHYTLTPKQELESMRSTIKTCQEITGTRPIGWYCREPSQNTIKLLDEAGGFLYDSDYYNDDLPYYINVPGTRKKMLIVPYTPDVNDFHYFSNRFITSNDFFEYLKDSFDTLYEEGGKSPKMMNVGVHVRISGRPGRTKALERFFDYVHGKEDVWVARRADIAKWWAEKHPAKAETSASSV